MCQLLLVNTANVEAIEKTCQQIQANGLSHADLRKTVWKRVENFLTSNGKLIPALVSFTKHLYYAFYLRHLFCSEISFTS